MYVPVEIVVIVSTVVIPEIKYKGYQNDTTSQSHNTKLRIRFLETSY